MNSEARTALTYRYECYRAAGSGVLETASATFLVLVAVQWFQAGALAKGCVAAGVGLGYLLTPWVVAAVERSRMPAADAAARLMFAGAALMAVGAVWAWEPVFVVTSLVSIATTGAVIPLVTQIYQDNYPDATRGRFFARTFMIRIAAATAFSFAAGYALSIDIAYFRGLLAIFAAVLALSGWCLERVPSAPLHVSGGQHPFHAMRYVRDDRGFRIMLISWMLMGFGNLMMLPLRVEYLANPKYHLQMRPDAIALLTGVVPNLARLVMTPLWGWLFDRANFFVVRMCLNIGFAIGIASFFASDSMAGLTFSAAMFGVSVGGGDVAWSLWVTKVAPDKRVADYMSVHTFFTGVRALVAPLVGFALVAHWSMTAMGWVSTALIVAASLMLVPEIKQGGLTRQDQRPGMPPIRPGIDEG